MTTTRSPLLSTGALDLLSAALPVVGGVAAFGLCVLLKHPWMVTFCSAVLVVTLAWAAQRTALRLGRGQFDLLVFPFIGVPLGISVGGAIGGLYGQAYGPEPADFRLAMAGLGASVFLLVGLIAELCQHEGWVSRDTARRRCAYGTLLLAGGLITLSVVAPLSV